MQSKATTVEEYLAELPDDRRVAISTVRDEIVRHLPKGYEEAGQAFRRGKIVRAIQEAGRSPTGGRR